MPTEEQYKVIENQSFSYTVVRKFVWGLKFNAALAGLCRLLGLTQVERDTKGCFVTFFGFVS
jgi:hypothetical protein